MSIRQSQLSNGTRIITETRSTIESVSVGLWVDVGSRYENLRLNGVTHCLEHMLFKGTKRRSARDIALEIEAVGGHMNAYTSRDHTTYYARVLKEDTHLALDVLGDILLNSRLDDGELTREKDVIIQEIGQTNDTPDDVIFDYLQEVSFKDQALGRSILGTPESVRSFTPDDLRTFLKERYTAQSVVLSAVGNLDHDALVAQAEDILGQLPAADVPKPDAGHFVGGERLDERTLEQTHVALGYEGVPFQDADYYALQLYSMVLGGGMSSRLFQQVREERGLAYSVYSFASSHADTGMLGIYAGTSPEMAREMMQVIKGEMGDLATTLSEDELMLGKAQLKAGLLMALESTTSRMEQLGRQMLIFGRTLSVDEITKSIEEVSLSDVKRIAERYAATQQTAFTAIGGGKLTLM